MLAERGTGLVTQRQAKNMGSALKSDAPVRPLPEWLPIPPEAPDARQTPTSLVVHCCDDHRGMSGRLGHQAEQSPHVLRLPPAQ